jgi:hypothetical protein
MISLPIARKCPIGPVRWRLSLFAEAVASVRASAACYRGLEDRRVVTMIVAELKLSDVEWQILAADVVIAAHDPALQKRPEAVDRLRVDRATCAPSPWGQRQIWKIDG